MNYIVGEAQKKAVVYCRVSTEDQNNSGLGLKDQESRCRAYCHASGWDIVSVLVDGGLSARDLDRPGIHKSLALLASGKADILVMLNLDRLTRSVKNLGAILERMQCQGWELACVENKVDTSTASGRLVLNVLISVSQWERERVAERTRAALAQKRNMGEKTGGERPLGFAVVQDNGKKKLREDPKEKKIIQLVLRLRRKGWSCNAIIRELSRRKIENTRGTISWNVGTISRILQRNGMSSQRNLRSDKGKKRKCAVDSGYKG